MREQKVIHLVRQVLAGAISSELLNFDRVRTGATKDLSPLGLKNAFPFGDLCKYLGFALQQYAKTSARVILDKYARVTKTSDRLGMKWTSEVPMYQLPKFGGALTCNLS